MADLWRECAVSGEVAEAVRCVRELDAPSFLHQVVKQIVSASVVDGGPREFDLAVQLTIALSDAGLLPAEQLALGCTRLVEAAADLRLDFPRAPEGLAKYLELCSEKRLLSPTDEWLATACRLRATGGPE